MSSELLLGKPVLYQDQYDRGLLFPVARQQNRALLPLDPKLALPFFGCDVWNGWEVSWLNFKGKPVIAHGVFRFPFDSLNIVESKSFKLYLNSFNGTRFESWQYVQTTMQRDLSNIAGGDVEVLLLPLPEEKALTGWRGTAHNLDDLDVDVAHYDVHASILQVDRSKKANETVYSQLLKSNCPVTGQPDWATVFVRYEGPQIDHESLLRYIISFRNHAEFHEHCVERMFCDLLQQCGCEKLTVYARYTRRGGLDINPFRSNFEKQVDNFICARQ